jgi:hypothetical protein
VVRALFLFLVAAPVMALDVAHGQQAGGIQVAPVMIAMSAEHNIAALRRPENWLPRPKAGMRFLVLATRAGAQPRYRRY